mmetsp:Transcript_3755/g.3670  ORF Transcript_3755/g.3670 Transcript_3755/m.3670 type:complete len:92 (+) Transcript_3755:1089-1364(+)
MHLTSVFNLFVVLQIFNLLNAKTLSGQMSPLPGHSASNFWIIIGFALGVHVLIVYCSSSLFHYELTLAHWSLAFGAGVLSLGCSFLLKVVA